MKKLVVLCFFPAFTPAVSGGELRLLNMYRQLSERFDISLVSWTYPQSRFEVVQHGPTFREYRVPKVPAFDAAYDSCHKAGIHGEVAGVVCAMVGRGDTQYHRLVTELVAGADAVVHEFPYTLLYDRGIGTDGKPRFYNSHNLESEMVTSLAHGARAQESIDLVTQLERSLVEQSRVVFATSVEELLKFRLLYGVPADRLRLAANGFSPEDFDFERNEAAGADSYALFMGSQHPPNVEGARFLVDVLAPQFPRQRFVIAGRVCQSIGSAPGNVRLLGEVSSEEKKTLFQRASFFVNPIFAGAGTSLKMVEAMAAGLPIITTQAGARGLGLENNVTALFAERDTFDRAVLRLNQDAELRQQLSEAARRAAFARLSWTTIGNSVADDIAEGIAEPVPAPKPRRPLTLVLNDYSVRDAVSGGSKRIYSLMRNIGRTSDVAMLCLHDKPVVELEELVPGFTEVRVPKTAEHKAFESGVNSRNWISINDLSAALFCLDNPILKRLFRRIGDNADTVVFSHPYMAPLLDSVGKHKTVVYESHNVEAGMKADILKPHSDGEILTSFVEKLESYLLERSDAVICTTEADRTALAELRPDIDGTVVLNGCEVLPANAAKSAIAQRRHRDLAKGFSAVFIGSGHPPNVEAAKALCANVLPRFPGMQLWVIGSVCESLDSFAHLSGLRRFGVVSDQEKHRLLLEADIALNPVVSGGGSNLKIADYLGYALPTVSTPDGVRGFAIEDGVHVLVRPQDRFVEAIEELVASPEKCSALAAAGHAMASASLDWARLSEQYEAVLRRVARPRPGKAPPRMLVVTYRYTEPCQGGAEEYLVRLLQRYAEMYGASIDLVAPDVGHITNAFHFASTYQITRTKPEQLFAPFLRDLTLFPPESLNNEDISGAAERLWRAWMAERRMLGRRGASFMPTSCLLGGWYDVEIHDTAFQRWSSDQAEIHVARDVSALRVSGWHAGSFDLDVRIDDEAPTRLTLRDNFSFELALTLGQSQCITLRMTAKRSSHEDPRHLGFLLKKLEVLQGRQGVWQTVSLEQGFDTLWRQVDPAAWIDALTAVTQQRPDAAEQSFLALRGPRSPALIEHIRTVAGQYDVVLVQGVPFSLTVDVMQALKDSGTPSVLLPHYHVDDAFYHWRQYYDCFTKANAVLSFSKWVSENFFAKIGATAPVIAGGGIEPSEYLARAAQLEQFRTFRGTDRPYFVVLGRKTGSKGYRTIIEAHQQLVISQGLDVDLVLIGPDEDRQPVEGRNVHYYGRLGREMMLGALAGCVGLVTMSTSESFGIVVVEAWMSGRPVIANQRCLSFTELVDDGKDGILVGTMGELTAAMRTLLENPAQARAMGSAGHRKAMETYSWSAAAHRFHDILVEVCGDVVKAAEDIATEPVPA